MEPTVENCFWDFNRTNAYESWIKENVKDKQTDKLSHERADERINE